MALVIIVEDDDNIRNIETIALSNNGHQILGFRTAGELFAYLDDDRMIPELIVLDVMLPDGNGFQVLYRLRKDHRYENISVIMVTAKSTEVDLIRGLESGADDYIKKPFSVLEFTARANAVLRRNNNIGGEHYVFGKLEVDHGSRKVWVDSNPVELTFREFELLFFLIQHAGNVRTREEIMRHVWGSVYSQENRSIDMYIKYLREKLHECGDMIKTVRGVGYLIERGNGGLI